MVLELLDWFFPLRAIKDSTKMLILSISEHQHYSKCVKISDITDDLDWFEEDTGSS